MISHLLFFAFGGEIITVAPSSSFPSSFLLRSSQPLFDLYAPSASHRQLCVASNWRVVVCWNRRGGREVRKRESGRGGVAFAPSICSVVLPEISTPSTGCDISLSLLFFYNHVGLTSLSLSTYHKEQRVSGISPTPSLFLPKLVV